MLAKKKALNKSSLPKEAFGTMAAKKLWLRRALRQSSTGRRSKEKKLLRIIFLGGMEPGDKILLLLCRNVHKAISAEWP